MTVRELINKLLDFNAEDEVNVVLSEYYVDDGPPENTEDGDDDELSIIDVYDDTDRLAVVIEVE